MNINKIVIWGHELHDHTHSYIHNGYYLAFKQLGFETYWFADKEENITKIDFNNTLFLTHGIQSQYIPSNGTSLYILHNFTQVRNIDKKNIINLQVYTKDCINRDIKDNLLKYHYYLEPPHACIFMPWATDLLPEQINYNINNLDKIINKRKNEINFIGMPGIDWDKVKKYCGNNNLTYNHYGATFHKYHPNNKSILENQELIQNSIVAPAIQTEWQVKNNYIPCRIFKNISYGKMGITNNKAVNELFNNKLIYSENIEVLLDKAIDFENNTNYDEKIKIIKELMEYVRDNHTYVNRINYILNYINNYLNIRIIY